MKALILALGVALALGAAAPGPDAESRLAGLRHTELRATYPAADTLHTHAVREVRLRYSTAVQLALSTVTVVGPEGVLRSADSLRYVAGSNETELQLLLDGPLRTGAYTVEWRTAGPDGHAIRGNYAFRVDWTEPIQDTVGAGAEPPEAPEPAAAPQLAEAPEDAGGETAAGGGRAGGVARWLLYLTVATAFGGSLFSVLVVGRVAAGGLNEAATLTRDRIGTLSWIGVAAGVLALPVTLVSASAGYFGGSGWAPADLARTLASPWGGGFALQGAGLAAVILGLVLRGRERVAMGRAVVGAGAAAIMLGGVTVGHAATEGVLAVVIQTLHGLAAATWVGGLACLVLAVLPATRKHPEALVVFVRRFSPVALAAVAVLIGTGAVTSFGRVGISELLTTSYGLTLVVKLGLAAGAFTLGFHNWRTVRPALESEPRPGLLRLPATLELTLAVTVLLVTAFFVVTPLP